MTALDALRVLRDCGVVRVRPGNRAYGVLLDSGLATCRRVLVVDRYFVDYSLTSTGRDRAATLPPFSERLV